MSSPAEKYKLAPSEDPLSRFRDEFVFPTFRQMKATRVSAEIGAPCVFSLSIRRSLILLAHNLAHAHTPGAPNDHAADEPCTYLCGNSLGLLPKRARKLVEEELDVWSTRCALL